jgi:hypothetical protein
MAFDLSEISQYYDLIAQSGGNPDLMRTLWGPSIDLDARDQNPMKDFIGPEKSGKPIIEKKSLSAGGSQKVIFTSMAPIGGQGVRGGAELKSKTAKPVYGTWAVTVDMRRFAISEDQLVELLRFNEGESRETLLYELCKQWWGMMEADDLQITLRDKALFATDQPNVYRIGGGSSTDEITLDDTFDTGTIEESVEQLIGLGAMPLNVQMDEAGSEVPEFVQFGPRRFMRSLEDEQKFREAVLHSQNRGGENFHWTGKYPRWKESLIHRHAIKFDSGNKRQGSPLLPIAFLGKAIPSNAATEVTGGGAHNTDDTKTDTVLYDYFSEFGGYYWKTYSTETAPTDNNTYYAMIYNVSGVNRGKYEIVSWVAAGNDGNTLTVTREIDGDGQKTALTSAGRYSAVHPSGSWIIPCNKWGVPIGRSLVMGAEALALAKGAIDADPIEWQDDFKSKTSGKAHINSSGIQGIRGYSPKEDSIGRYPNFLLVEGALDYGFDLVDLT